MILWKDFVIDDVIGPYLVCSDEVRSSLPVMEDGSTTSIIQETRQEIRPARMVGSSNLDSTIGRLGMDADPVLDASFEQGRSG